MVDKAGQSERRLRIALAHDWLVGMRGGERVLEGIARALAPHHDLVALYTMFDDGHPLSPHLDGIPKRVSGLGRMPGGLRVRRWLLPLYPWAVRGLSRRLAREHARAPIDLVISTSSAAIKGLRTPPGVPHLCYCHSPARYLWSQAREYGGGVRGLGLLALGPVLRRWDRRSAARVSEFLANSTHIQSEIRRCYGRESRVVFPPVRTGFFTPAEDGGTPRPAWLVEAGFPPEREFWVAAGALEPYKRIDIAVNAADACQVSLVIAGRGSDEEFIRECCGDLDVTLLGRVSDEQLRDLFRAARLLVFPQVEDFGITAVEAQACGCPVLARGAGGALDTVIDGRTGAYFASGGADPGRDGPSDQQILEAVKRVPQRSAETTAACRANAERFSEAAFAAGILEAVSRVCGSRGAV